MGAGNISIHGRKRPRYTCQNCGKTFSARKGTMFEGLRTDEEKVELVVTLLTYGCPLQAIVHTFGLDERTVAAWQKRAGTHWKPSAHGCGATRKSKEPTSSSRCASGQKEGRSLCGWQTLWMFAPAYGLQGR